MEDKLLENEENLNENIEEVEENSEPVANVNDEEPEVTAEEASTENDNTEEPIEEAQEEPSEESEEEPNKEITVAEVEEAEPVVAEEVHDDKEEIRGIEENIAFHKSVKFKKTINKVSLALLLLALAIPVGLLVYVILTFFL